MQSWSKKKNSKSHLKENEKELYTQQKGHFPQPKEEQTKATISMAAPVMAVPAMAAATHYVPTISTPPASTERTVYCETCSALGRPCPLFTSPAPAVSLPHSDWSDFEVEEDWDGERQKEEEREKNRQHGEKELTDKNYFPPSPKYMPNTPSDTDDTLAPELTNTLVLTSEKTQEEEEEEKEKTIKEEDKDTESDYDSDDTVTILRAEYV